MNIAQSLAGNRTTYSLPDQTGNTYWATFEATPFSSGNSRFAYRGTLHGNGPKNNGKCVVKVAKGDYKGHPRASEEDRLCSAIASDYARRWNTACPTTRPVDYQVPLIAKIEQLSFDTRFTARLTHPEAASQIGIGEFVTIEDYLSGQYEKWNNNAGWVSTVGETSVPAAFSHFTYQASGGQLIVVDIQGVRTEVSYRLTDPAIHSLSRSYGSTDHGAEGIAMFFRSHQCNDLCRSLGLQIPRPGSSAPLSSLVRFQGYHGTVYQAQLQPCIFVGPAFGGGVAAAHPGSGTVYGAARLF